MSFALKFTKQAEGDFNSLEEDQSLLKRFQAVRKALGYLEANPRHPSLNTDHIRKTAEALHIDAGL